MGLDVSAGDVEVYHGAYSAFMRYRQLLAKAAGIPLMLMDSFIGACPYLDDRDGPGTSPLEKVLAALRPKQSAFTEPGVITRDSLLAALGEFQSRPYEVQVMSGVLDFLLPWLPLTWDHYAHDPICILLNHSDCDGEIAGADQQRALADRLEELLPKLPGPDWPEGWGHLRDPQAVTRQWIDGLRHAADRGLAVRFH